MLRGRLEASSPVAVAALVGANLLPLAGVVVWGWSVAEILVLYWIENAVVGLFQVPKVLFAKGEVDSKYLRGRSTDAENAGTVSKLLIAVFVLPGYAMFWIVHGALVALWLSEFGAPFWATLSAVPLAAGSLFVSHAVSFTTNYVAREEYETVSPWDIARSSNGRVFTLHFTVLLGGFAVAALGSRTGLVALLVVFKTAFDLRRHLREHEGAGGTDAEASPSTA